MVAGRVRGVVAGRVRGVVAGRVRGVVAGRVRGVVAKEGYVQYNFVSAKPNWS